MAQKTSVHGFTVQYEQNADYGIRHLRDDLDYNEARVFFDQARVKSQVQFEDDGDRQYTLTYHDGLYTIIRR